MRSTFFWATVCSWFVVLVALAAPAPPVYRIASPDKQTQFDVQVDARQRLVYRVIQAGKTVVGPSVLGFRLNELTIGQQTVLGGMRQRTHREQIKWPLGENDIIRNHYTEMSVQVRSAGVAYTLVVRVFDGSVAFRYVLPNTSAPGVIRQELTSFDLGEDYTIYQYNEESVFTPTSLSALHKTCDFPATLTNGRLYLSIGEADNQSYTKAVLARADSPHALTLAFGRDSVRTSGPFVSPWRTISVATSAIGLHQFSDLALRLCPPPRAGVPNWIKPGKLIRAALTTQGGLDCIDFAAAHGFNYIMFDAGWYGAEFRSSSDPTQVIPAIDMPRVIQYGKDKGRTGQPIGVILYVNRVGLRAKLDTILPLYRRWGVAGLKFGFVDGLSHEGLNWLIPAIKKVYDHGFVLNIHDNYKPTGLSRTYPNLLTQEGIRGNENNPDAFHNTVLPFTRFVGGAADYTFCYPNANGQFSDNLLKTKLQVTKGQQLALTVVYFSPLQAMLWYGNPVHYTNEVELEVFARVPTVWNESHYLTGEIGRHVSVARRKGNTWYVGTVAGLTDWQGTIPLSFLPKGKRYVATVYEDDGGGSIQKRSVTLTGGQAWPVRIKARGGQVIMLQTL